MNNHNCRVCGLYLDNLPWGEDDNSPTYEFCPCCGVEFGYQDYSIDSAKKYRIQWINSGDNWYKENEKPIVWDKEEQLKCIPEEFK